MASENSFFKYNETRALSGYKSAWLVKDATLNKYVLVSATESVPYVFGDKESYSFDLLQSPTVGQVEGKLSLEKQDIEVLHHRDNAYRFEQLKGKVLDFMTINAEYVGYKFSGTIDYKPNNAEADVNKATVTITPISASVTPVFNARDEIMETLCFASVIPTTVKSSDTIDLSLVQLDSVDNVELTMIKLLSDGTPDPDFTQTTISSFNYTVGTTGLFAITASHRQKVYAPVTTTVYVEA